MCLTTIGKAIREFREADEAWQAGLDRHFGKRGRDARYQPAGQDATPEIAKLYAARHAAYLAHCAAWDVARAEP